MNQHVNAGLFCELYWGETLAEVWSFGPEQPQIHAAPDEKVPLPLYGFTLPEEPFLLAERTAQGYRVFIPPGVKLERSTKGDAFHGVPESQIVQHAGRRCVELPEGPTLRLSEGELRLLIQHSVAKDREKHSRVKLLARVAVAAIAFLSLPVGLFVWAPDPLQMQENNARAIRAAKEKDLARRRALGIDTPLRPLTQTEQQEQKPDGGTSVTLPASFSVQ
jgi:hypothetical protein